MASTLPMFIQIPCPRTKVNGGISYTKRSHKSTKVKVKSMMLMSSSRSVAVRYSCVRCRLGDASISERIGRGILRGNSEQTQEASGDSDRIYAPESLIEDLMEAGQ